MIIFQTKILYIYFQKTKKGTFGYYVGENTSASYHSLDVCSYVAESVIYWFRLD